jgi:hypothetical protein
VTPRVIAVLHASDRHADPASAATARIANTKVTIAAIGTNIARLPTGAVIAADIDVLDGLVADAGPSEGSAVVAVVDFAAG